MLYDGPSPAMSYRYGDQLQPGAGEITPARYEREHEDEDDEHGVTWHVVYDQEEI